MALGSAVRIESESPIQSNPINPDALQKFRLKFGEEIEGKIVNEHSTYYTIETADHQKKVIFKDEIVNDKSATEVSNTQQTS